MMNSPYYAELHAHSHFSFLDGACSPAQLVEQATHLGLAGVSLTDHDGLYGAPAMAEAAEQHPQLLTMYGSELSLGLTEPQNGREDPEGEHLLVLARGPEGYHRLCRAITEAHLHPQAQKGQPHYQLERLAEHGCGHWVILTGCRKGAVRQGLAHDIQHGSEPVQAREKLEHLGELFGREHVVVELYDHGHPGDSAMNHKLADMAHQADYAVVATNNVHYALPQQHRLASTMAAIRARKPLIQMDGWLPAGPGAFVRSPAEMAARFAHIPEAVAYSVTLARQLAFPLTKAKPRLPKLELPAGRTQMGHLRELVWEAAGRLYQPLTQKHRARLNKELELIERKDFPGYFLIVKDLVDFARGRGILCQGRGSAASSAVCYVLGITAIDAIYYKLPFERFLNEIRDEEPDIDIDFDADRREEVIQYVYEKYGRLGAAQVCNVISYRSHSAVRDVAKALGYSPTQADNFSKKIESYHSLASPPDVPADIQGLAEQLMSFPRHLGIHSGGMVLTEQAVSEFCPVEPARMPGRTVLQWDKDACSYMGLVKFDLLGLGILSAIDRCFQLVATHCGQRWSLASIPREEAAVYDQLCQGDAIGVFQVESRAQMNLLPRLQPRCFYDLVIEVALVRPGPIQGGAVHPYLRRRRGQEKVSYAHPRLLPVLERTLGVPIFQEQLMSMAMAVGNCSAADADTLRRAMGSKRGVERMESVKEKLFAGMRANGLSERAAQELYTQVKGFADFGFAESHALSFAVLVYVSAWLRLHYPAAFLASLLSSQPMGFYSPNTLVTDARRHGVQVLGVDIQCSQVSSVLEECGERVPGLAACTHPLQPPVGPFEPERDLRLGAHRRDGGFAVRLGLAEVSGVGVGLAERIVQARAQGGAFEDMDDVARRVSLSSSQMEALARAGAFAGFTEHRALALWQAGVSSRAQPSQLPVALPHAEPVLPAFSDWDELVFDLRSTGISPADHPLRHLRASLDARGIVPIAALGAQRDRAQIRVAGIVTHRQRPATAKNVTFINLEDETGLVNIVCSQRMWHTYRGVACSAAGLVIVGVLERSPEGVVSVQARSCRALTIPTPSRSRDFR